LERKLSKIEDFKRFSGKKAKVKLHEAWEDHKTFVGIIAEVSEDTIVLILNDEKRLEITFDMISTARLAI